MKFVLILLIVAILTILKREACQTESKGKKNAETTCGKGQKTYNFDGSNTLTDQQIIQQVLPWTVLMRIVQKSHIEYCVGVVFHESVVALSPPCAEIPAETAREEEINKIDLFLAKYVSKDAATDENSLPWTRTVTAASNNVEFGALVKIHKDPKIVSEDPQIQPICVPEDSHSRCLIVGWRIEKGSFVAKVFKPKILGSRKCKKIWGDRQGLMVRYGICAESEEMRLELQADTVDSKFAYGPLVCYDDKTSQTWSLDGLARFQQKDKGNVFLFWIFEEYLKMRGIKEKVEELKKP